jgi:hypothetical protein
MRARMGSVRKGSLLRLRRFVRIRDKPNDRALHKSAEPYTPITDKGSKGSSHLGSQTTLVQMAVMSEDFNSLQNK